MVNFMVDNGYYWLLMSLIANYWLPMTTFFWILDDITLYIANLNHSWPSGIPLPAAEVIRAGPPVCEVPQYGSCHKVVLVMPISRQYLYIYITFNYILCIVYDIIAAAFATGKCKNSMDLLSGFLGKKPWWYLPVALRSLLSRMKSHGGFRDFFLSLFWDARIWCGDRNEAMQQKEGSTLKPQKP